MSQVFVFTKNVIYIEVREVAQVVPVTWRERTVSISTFVVQSLNKNFMHNLVSLE